MANKCCSRDKGQKVKGHTALGPETEEAKQEEEALSLYFLTYKEGTGSQDLVLFFW